MKTTSTFFLATLLLAAIISSGTASRDLGEGSNMPWFGGGGVPNWAAPFVGKDWGGFTTPSMVCKQKGKCYNKKLTCPSKCFKSWSTKGKHGGGGGCSFDCKKCAATC